MTRAESVALSDIQWSVRTKQYRELLEKILKSKDEIEGYIGTARSFLSALESREEAESIEDIESPTSRALTALNKLESNFRKFIKLAESQLASSTLILDAEGKDEKAIITVAHKITRRIKTVCKAYPEFPLMPYQFEKLSSLLMKSASSLEDPHFAKRSVSSENPPPDAPDNSEQEIVTTPTKSSDPGVVVPSGTSAQQQLQLEVKLKSIDDKMLRKILLSLAADNADMLHKINNKVEELKRGEKQSNANLFSRKKWKNSMKKNKFQSLSPNLQKELQNVLGSPTDGPTPVPLQITNRLMEGYLTVKVEAQDIKWKKRWVVLDNANLYLFKSPDVLLLLFSHTRRIHTNQRQ